MASASRATTASGHPVRRRQLLGLASASRATTAEQQPAVCLLRRVWYARAGLRPRGSLPFAFAVLDTETASRRVSAGQIRGRESPDQSQGLRHRAPAAGKVRGDFHSRRSAASHGNHTSPQARPRKRDPADALARGWSLQNSMNCSSMGIDSLRALCAVRTGSPDAGLCDTALRSDGMLEANSFDR